MTLTKIELEEGHNNEFLFHLRDIVIDTVIEVLKLPTDERNIRIIESKKGLFQMKPPYEIIIEITMFTGRKKETKKKLFELLVERLYESLHIEKEKVFIHINEQPQENWDVRGGIPANEVHLGFRVEI